VTEDDTNGLAGHAKLPNTNFNEKLNATKVSLSNSLTDVSEDFQKNDTNGNEIGRIAKWATGFEKLLDDSAGLQIFTVNI
jgi:arylamine N-acetyltransferase